MFNNFICEKKSKFKTKGKIVITKKTNHSTPENHIRWFNQTQPRPKPTKSDPDQTRPRYSLTESNLDSLTWTNPTLRHKILKKTVPAVTSRSRPNSTWTKTNQGPNFFRIFQLKLTVNPVPGLNWIKSVIEDQKPWTGWSVNPGLTLSIFMSRFSLFLSR